MSEQKHLYVVFSSTNGGIGRFIRFMTKNQYNHTSVTLDPTLSTLYSFARYHKSAPFYAGFVCESCLRYKNQNAKIKVAAIPLTEEQYSTATDFFDDVKNSKDAYIYNLLSAITNVTRRKISINKAYTCVEFAVKTLDTVGIDNKISSAKFYTIKELENLLCHNIVYEGTYPDWSEDAQWGDDLFISPIGFVKGSVNSLRTQARLLKRLVKS